ncbi:hypothetical protein B0E41_05975 [Hydrogenophaga sp. A37]|nr:hypothetical protein B0E41_05975 [Hydrogenophaga sp. A37]
MPFEGSAPVARRTVFLRSNFNRPALVRQLAGFLPEGAPALTDAPRQDLAERLGQWLNVADAITLSSAHPSIAAVGARAAQQPGRAPTAAANTLQTELDRVRTVLARSITTRDPKHRPDANDLDTEFALFHQRYQDQQRRMEMSVDALREHVRQTLAKGESRLAQLAALDAVMDQMLGGREQRLLAGLPAYLKARFKALRQAAAASDTPDDLRWLQGFEAELEQTLLAELEHRLQPVVGMIEALEV